MKELDRRGFILGGSAFAAAASAGCRSVGATGKFDENLSVFIADPHIAGPGMIYEYSPGRFTKFIDRILAMRPLPKRVICFGDVAEDYGLLSDYVASKPMYQRFVDAGIEVHLTLGNHDRRSNFLKVWPEYARGPVSGRCTRVIDLGHCDLVLLDTLSGADDRPENDMGPVGGVFGPEQLEWFKRWVAAAKRPFFVGSHHLRDLDGGKTPPAFLVGESDFACGWIHGHNHMWDPGWTVASWGRNKALPVLALPSAAQSGDIGYVVFRTSPDGAEAELVQEDFYFQTPTAHAVRPRAWDVRVAQNQGARVRFAFN